MNDLEEKLISGYLNDGFIYCILTNLHHTKDSKLVKIGKTRMNGTDTEDQVYQKLLRRYNTYYPNYSVILFKRTGNCHLAESLVFEELQELHHKKEMYMFDESKINSAFAKALDRYKCVDELLKCCYDLEILNKANNLIKIERKKNLKV